MSPLLEIGGGAAAITAVIGLLVLLYSKVLRPLARGFRYVAEFLEDWRGEPARPGHPGRPGIPERIEKVEHQTGRAEFHYGNGNPTAMRTVLDQVAHDVAAMKGRVEELETTIETHHPKGK